MIIIKFSLLIKDKVISVNVNKKLVPLTETWLSAGHLIMCFSGTDLFPKS